MALTTEQKKEILAEYGLHETDTGSPEAQIALLTQRIRQLTEHLKTTPVVACFFWLVAARAC